MKKYSLLTGLLLTALHFTACSSDATEQPDPAIPVAIAPTAWDAADVNGDTRGDGLQAGFTTARSYFALRLDKSGGNYPANYSTVPAKTAQNTAGSDVLNFSSTEYYLSDGVPSKVLYIYPSGGTYTPGTGSSTYAVTLDGAVDLMTTPLSGEGTAATAIPSPIYFSHLLTQLKFTVKADGDGAITVWGNVTNISVKDQPTSATLTLPGTTTTSSPSVTTWGVSANLAATKKSNGTAVSNKTLTTTYDEYGLVLTQPYTSDTKLYLSITTVNSGGAFDLELPDKTYLAGYAYEIQLIFKVNAIQPTATITTWSTGAALPNVEV
jgi:hypothetical protein